MIGTIKTIIGAPKVKKVEALYPNPNNEITEIMKPIYKAPQSPIKIFAGWKLKNKKPIILPARMSDKEAMSLLPDNKEVIEIVTRTIIEIPADNPSNPSIKLIALVIPTIQNKVTTPERNVIASLGKYPNPFI